MVFGCLCDLVLNHSWFGKPITFDRWIATSSLIKQRTLLRVYQLRMIRASLILNISSSFFFLHFIFNVCVFYFLLLLQALLGPGWAACEFGLCVVCRSVLFKVWTIFQWIYHQRIVFIYYMSVMFAACCGIKRQERLVYDHVPQEPFLWDSHIWLSYCSNSFWLIDIDAGCV